MKKVNQMKAVRLRNGRLHKQMTANNHLTQHTQVSAGELWEMICGSNSILGLFAGVRGLHYLVQGINVETVADERFQASVTIDPSDGVSPLMRISTGTYHKIYQRMKKGIDILSKDNHAPMDCTRLGLWGFSE
ncbi:hypothetical protein [Methylovulum psychrotolerans]|uniref:Uncharacterized protein n=1 Tax=Methylovulum psychrotolerans TaxID=1704499 RepID=A0A1Z4C4S4_9GAMM|nr:hypothetical protein [Methylovulum psychrotolerans]ASF48484.1 hypothetical protein CEK71_21835 [Methylovulum psychrotolerans]